MTTNDMFGGFAPAEYEAEAESRWGHTNEYRVSQERTKKYSQQDWSEATAEGNDIAVPTCRCDAGGDRGNG